MGGRRGLPDGQVRGAAAGPARGTAAAAHCVPLEPETGSAVAHAITQLQPWQAPEAQQSMPASMPVPVRSLACSWQSESPAIWSLDSVAVDIDTCACAGPAQPLKASASTSISRATVASETGIAQV